MFLSLTGHAAEQEGRSRSGGHEASRQSAAGEDRHERRDPAVLQRRATSRRGRPRPAIGNGLIVTRRNMLQVLRIPTVFIFELVQPVMFVLLFRFVFAETSRICHPASTT